MPTLKGLYFTSVNKDQLRNKRIIDKCLGQIDCFTKKDWHTDFICQSDEGLLFNGNKIGIKGRSQFVKWLQEKSFTLFGNFREVKNICARESYDYVYFRHSFFNPAALRLFKRIKRINPQTIIIVEISTYPYKQEFKGPVKRILSWVDLLSARALRNNVDYVASCSPDEHILNIPVLHFSNGLMRSVDTNVARIPNFDALRMVAIASNISYWHGFDRIIAGVQTYMKAGGKKIRLDIIGEGTAKKELQQQVQSLGLQDVIFFIDKIPSEEVINRLRDYDLAFSTLGMHRKGVHYDSSMKSRDYAYAGVPFVLCTPDASFETDGPYWKYVPNTNEAIDIAASIQFLEQLQLSHPDYQHELSAFATKTLDWEYTFSEIVSAIARFGTTPYKHPALNAFCYYFPPIKAIGSIRTYSFVQQMQHHGFATTVYSTSNADLCFVNEELFDEQIPTIKIPTLDFRTIADRPKGANNNIGKNTRITPVKAILLKVLNSFPVNILIGEGGLFYIIRGYQKAKKDITASSIIFSSFRPYSDHIIAYLLKRKFKNLFWIADFRDLHYDKHINDFYLGGLQNWFNRVVLKKASLVTTISIGLQEKLLTYNNNVYVLRNGIIEEQHISQREHYDKFTINYTGSLYAGKRDSKKLFEAISRLITTGVMAADDVQLQYAGQHGAIWNKWISQYKLDSLNKTLGMVSTKEAMLMQTKSHINLLLSWSSPEVSGILTGKFYEYLKTKNPVILIINGIEDKEFVAVFQETNCGAVFYNDTPISQLADYVFSLYQQWKADRDLDQFAANVKNEQYKWPALINRFIESAF